MKNGRFDKGNPPVNNSVQWELHGSLLGQKLSELEPNRPVAGELSRLLVTLDEHAAITLRDEITHSLTPLTGAPELCLLRVLDVDGNQLRPLRVLSFLWPRATEAKPGITSAQLWPDAISEIRDAMGLLLTAVERLIELIDAVGVARNPQLIYRDITTGRTSLTDPR